MTARRPITKPTSHSSQPRLLPFDAERDRARRARRRRILRIAAIGAVVLLILYWLLVKQPAPRRGARRGDTIELQYRELSTDTLIALRRIFGNWPGLGGGVARARLRVVERILAERGAADS